MTTDTKRILFATKNPGKLLEFKKAFNKLNEAYEVISFDSLDYDVPDCDETGETFAENALIKAENARTYLHDTELDVIIVADDSGLRIDALGGEPGVYTRRWSGSNMTDNEIIAYCLAKMAGIQDRSASYVSYFAVLFPDGTKKIINGTNRGIILSESNSGSQLPGMPFRSLFYVPVLEMMFHEARDLPINKRKGYKLGHEEAIREIIHVLP